MTPRRTYLLENLFDLGAQCCISLLPGSKDIKKICAQSTIIIEASNFHIFSSQNILALQMHFLYYDKYIDDCMILFLF